MIYTPKIKKAIGFAIEAHQGQTRKGKNVPYITHPLAVGLILARAGAGEDVVVAGILHDTIEDSKEEDKPRVRNFIAQEFGGEVYRMVDDVTEQDKSLPWEQRKQIALEHVAQMGKDSLLVKSADVLHNMTDLVSDVEKEGDSVFGRFNAPKEKQFERYANLVKALEGVWPENPLLPEIREKMKKRGLP